MTRSLSRRRVPLLPVLVPLLRRDRDLVLTHHAADPLMLMSVVTIGRRLAPELAKMMAPGRSHSKWGNVMELLEWDAQTYDSLPLPHRRWGSSAIERLTLTGNETVPCCRPRAIGARRTARSFRCHGTSRRSAARYGAGEASTVCACRSYPAARAHDRLRSAANRGHPRLTLVCDR